MHLRTVKKYFELFFGIIQVVIRFYFLYIIFQSAILPLKQFFGTIREYSFRKDLVIQERQR